MVSRPRSSPVSDSDAKPPRFRTWCYGVSGLLALAVIEEVLRLALPALGG
jgi:hypothetical protein